MKQKIIFDIDTCNILNDINIFDNDELIITSSKFYNASIKNDTILLEEGATSTIIIPIH